MADFAGSIAVAIWNSSAGTINIASDFREMNYAPSIEYIDTTAGGDGNRSRLAYVKDGVFTASGLLQAGSAPAWGSAFAEGQVGTLVFSPEGTAATKMKQTIPGISNGFPFVPRYNDAVEFNISIQQNGARTDGTN